MKLDVAKLPFIKELKISEEVTFDPTKYIRHLPLVDVLKCTATAKIQRFEEFIYLDLSIVAKVILQCSFSLANFEMTLKGNDELHFSAFVDEDDEDLIVYKGNVIDLDEYIFNLLSACVPMSPKAPGAKNFKDGKGYRIITDETLQKEKEEKGNSQFDALKDLDFD